MAGEYSVYLKQALDTQNKMSGTDSPATAISVSNLAVLYLYLEDFAKAEPLCQQALDIWQKSVGPDHPVTALSLCNLAAVYDGMREYARAEPLLEQALRINLKNFGREHPRTVLYLDNLGYLKFQLGLTEEAKDIAHLKAKAELALLSKVFLSRPNNKGWRIQTNLTHMISSFSSTEVKQSWLQLSFGTRVPFLIRSSKIVSLRKQVGTPTTGR
jgi:tetratricopeptide (TPR) repeat protein